jgi:signal transduction histidine kinase
MFNEMIEFARLDRRQVQVSIEKTDVVPLLRMAAEELRLAGEAGGIHLSAQEDRVPEVWCDSSKIRQILHNLVANALKFTPSGGSIRLFARTLSEVEVMVGVSDTGIGIPQDELPKIFERFHQVPGRLPLRKAEGGTGLGLGLSICRSLVELQKGRIWAESPAGGGSNIFFTLPSAEGNP